MSNTPHMLGEEFPGQTDRIRTLKAADPGFASLLREYDEVNDKIYLAETKVDPISQDHETTLRKQRLSIKDRIAEALRAD